jgi:hypothetical protein
MNARSRQFGRNLINYRPGALLYVCRIASGQQSTDRLGKVISQPPLKVEVVAVLGTRLLFFLVPSLFFLLFDSIIPSLSVSFKTQGADGLPTRGRGATRRGNGTQWYQIIGVSLLNILLSVAIQAGVELLFTEVFHIRSALKVTTTLPMPWSIAKDVLRGLLLREVYYSISNAYQTLTVSGYSILLSSISLARKLQYPKQAS